MKPAVRKPIRTPIKGPSINPWAPYAFRKVEVMALKALHAGNASEGQQQLAFQLLLALSGAGDLEFRPGGEDGRRASDFASGKRFVGLQLIKAATMQVAALNALED